MLAFTSADIIFYKLLELHASLSEKKIFVTNFPFLTDSLKPPHPPYRPKSAKRDKGFLSMLPYSIFFSEQEPPRLFLPNGAKLLRLAHEPSQNLI